MSKGYPPSPPWAGTELPRHFQALIHWQHNRDLLPGRDYLLSLGRHQTLSSVTRIKFRFAADEISRVACATLGKDQQGICNITLTNSLPVDATDSLAIRGHFRLLDPGSLELLGTGTVQHGLRRATNLSWQTLAVDKPARARALGQTPRAIWLTGLSGSGKSTIANVLEQNLLAAGKHSYLLDGDNVRHGLNRDLGFTDADRVENIRRVAETAKLMVDAGLIVVVSFISPFRADRAMARSLFEPNEFIEVYVDTPLGECERRDPKGLYRKARAGELKNFTGLDSPYECPSSPELHIRTSLATAEQAAAAIMDLVNANQNCPDGF